MFSHQPGGGLQPLCYEHHREMRLDPNVSGNGTTPAHEPVYVCQESDCSVRYTSAAGYFIAPREGRLAEEEILPRVRCPHDGAPMYLGEVNPEERSFRLWQCPLCKATSKRGQAVMAAG